MVAHCKTIVFLVSNSPQPPPRHTNYTTTTISTHKLHHNHHLDTQTTPQPPPRHTNYTTTTVSTHKLHHNHRLDTQTILQPPSRHTNYTTTTVSTPRESIQPRAINAWRLFMREYPPLPIARWSFSWVNWRILEWTNSLKVRHVSTCFKPLVLYVEYTWCYTHWATAQYTSTRHKE